MHMRLFHPILFSLLIMVLFLTGCENDESPVVIIINPADANMEGNANDFLYFNVEIRCIEPISSFLIQQKDATHGIVSLFDSIPDVDKINCAYSYKIPTYKDSSEVFLEFIAKSKNYSSTLSKRILIHNEEILLEEFSGNVIFSALSGKADAFSLKMNQSVFSKNEPDSLVDIMDASTDSIDNNVLSRKWISKSGMKFVRFEDFNYSTATRQGVKDAFQIASKYNFISDLKTEDIILIGKDEASAALKITQIIDEDSVLNDKYYFNIKMVE